MGRGREWQRARRRDRSLGAASPVRQVAITPELERAALAASGGAISAPQAPLVDGPRWQRSRAKPGAWTRWERY